jgi:hypothetical protein
MRYTQHPGGAGNTSTGGFQSPSNETSFVVPDFFFQRARKQFSRSSRFVLSELNLAASVLVFEVELSGFYVFVSMAFVSKNSSSTFAKPELNSGMLGDG